jgi:hypothetical protein
MLMIPPSRDAFHSAEILKCAKPLPALCVPTISCFQTARWAELGVFQHRVLSEDPRRQQSEEVFGGIGRICRGR